MQYNMLSSLSVWRDEDLKLSTRAQLLRAIKLCEHEVELMGAERVFVTNAQISNSRPLVASIKLRKRFER